MVEYAHSLGTVAPPGPVGKPFEALRTALSRAAAWHQATPRHAATLHRQPLGAPAAGADLPRWQLAAVFAVFAVVVAVPVVLHPLPPISDYINHLSRMHVLAALGSDSDLTRFYQVDWQVIPNLMMDMVLPVLVRFINVYAAGQAFMITSFVLILASAFALNRQLHGRWSVMPLLAFPLLYNHVFLVGTMNYVCGIGLSLWALVAWIALRERHWALRLPVSTLFVVTLFFCHLFVVGVYGLGLLAFELNRLWSLRPVTPRRLADFAATGVAFVPLLPLLALSPTWGLRGNISWDLHGKLEGLFFVVEVYSGAVAAVLVLAAAVAAAWALHRRALRFHLFGMLLLGIGAAVYLAMPRIIFDTYMADQRLPISLAFMIVASVQLDFDRLGTRPGAARWGAVAALLLALLVRVSEVQTAWTALSPTIAQFRESVEQIDRGAKVMVAYADPDGGDDVRDLGLVHAACLAVIERSALVTTVFTVVGKQVVHARADFRDRVDTKDGSPPTVDRLMRIADRPGNDDDYWRRWTTDYDYLYVLFTDSRYRNPDPARLTPVFAGDKFMLYRIENAQIADAGKE